MTVIIRRKTPFAKGRKKSEDVDVLFLRGLNADLKANFKAWCAKRGKSMKEMIVGYMESKVSKSLAAE